MYPEKLSIKKMKEEWIEGGRKDGFADNFLKNSGRIHCCQTSPQEILKKSTRLKGNDTESK